MIIPNQKQALEQLRPHGYRGPNRLMSERSGSGGKVKAHANKFPRPITAAGSVHSGGITALGAKGSHGMGV
jgi:hypothetical protein